MAVPMTNLKVTMRMKIQLFFILLVFMFTGTIARSQSLMDLLDEETGNQVEYTTATFKSSRIINGHSIERMQAGQLDFRIHHRFGTLNSGAYEFWGLDQANIHLGLEYGITDWVMIGIGRGTYQKTFDSFVHFSILRQSSGKKTMPLSLSAYTTMAINSLKWENPDQENYFSSRLAYTFHIMLARKFSERLSLQLSPSLVHKNMVETLLDANDLFSIGMGGRFKLTKRLSINGEYYYVFRPQHSTDVDLFHNSLSLGLDIETGGHVFSLLITNSQPMVEKGFITETSGNWLDGDIRFGFNISRVFALK